MSAEPAVPPPSSRRPGPVEREAERTVEIAASLALIDQARHLLDGRHDSCQVCEPTLAHHLVDGDETWTGDQDPDSEEADPVVVMEVVHAADCPVPRLIAARERLAAISRE